MDPTIADTTLHRLARMLPTPGVRRAAWPGRLGSAAPQVTLHAGDAHLIVRVERVSVAGARLLAPTATLVQLSSQAPAGRPEALRLRVRHASLDQPLHLPCVLVGARARGEEHALAVRFCTPDDTLDGIHTALRAAFDQRGDDRHPVHEDVVPVLLNEAWRGRRLRGVVRDLSARGLGIVLDLPLEEAPDPGEPVSLRLRLPGHPLPMVLHGCVRRARARALPPPEQGVLVEVGLALADETPGDAEAAARIARHLEGAAAG
jgi:hypothetical protein